MSLLKDFYNALLEVIKLPFHLLGAVFRRVKRLGIRHLTVLSVAALFLTVFIIFTFFKITSQSMFCESCHIMRPYITAWENSSHKDIDCMKCHAREGFAGYMETKFTAMSMLANYFTGIYKRSKPWAEIEDDRCLECHETRLLDGEIEFTKGVVFDHTPHLTEKKRGRSLRCTSCHSQIVQGEHISVTTSTCFLCHFKNVYEEDRAELANCNSCHNPPTGAFAAENDLHDHALTIARNIDCSSCHQQMWQGLGEVRKERCGTCHSEAAHIERIVDLEFIHEWHIEKRKVDCQACHDAITHNQPKIDKDIRSNCSSCHDDKHLYMSEVYQGIGSRLIRDPMPDPMYNEGVTCVSCHKNGKHPHFMSSIGKNACVPCHEQSYLNLAEEWRTGYGSRIKSLELVFRNVGAHPKLEEARQDLAHLKRGGPWHNPTYADSLLERISLILREAGGNPPDHPKVPTASSECVKCHSGITSVQVVKEFSEFDHSAHLSERGIACIQCHVDTSPDNLRHGQQIEQLESCAKCHHREDSMTGESCEPCHQPSRILYFGQLPDMEPSPSPMAESDMSCTDCHEPTKYLPPENSLCIDCHDEEIVDDLEFTRGEIVSAIGKIKGRKTKPVRLILADKGRAVHHPDLAKETLSNIIQ